MKDAGITDAGGQNGLKVRRLDAVCCLVLLTIALVIGLTHFTNGIDLGDEGFLAYGAVRVQQGQLPNRDFMSYQPPLSFYTAATMFDLFGRSLAVLRLLGLVIYLAVPVMVFCIARHLADPITSFIAAAPSLFLGIPFFWFVPSAVWHGILFSLAASLLIMRAVHTKKPLYSFLAGITTALVFLSRHDQGLYVTISILVYFGVLSLICKDNLRHDYPVKMPRYWMAGLFACSLPCVLFWTVHGAIPDMFQQLIVFPLTGYAKTSSLPIPHLDLNQSLKSNMIISLFYLQPVLQGVVILLLLFLFICRGLQLADADIIFVLALSILFYCQVLTRSDFWHLIITMGPSFILMAWLIERASGGLYHCVKKFFLMATFSGFLFV